MVGNFEGGLSGCMGTNLYCVGDVDGECGTLGGQEGCRSSWKVQTNVKTKNFILILEVFSRKFEGANGEGNVLPTLASLNEKLRNSIFAKRKLVVLLFKYSR